MTNNIWEELAEAMNTTVQALKDFAMTLGDLLVFRIAIEELGIAESDIKKVTFTDGGYSVTLYNHRTIPIHL